MTTATPERMTFTTVRDVAGNPDALQQLQDGLANAWATAADMEMTRLYDHLPDEIAESPAVLAYERMVDAAIGEIAPAVAAMLEQAVAKRLPFEWDGDKPPVIDPA